MCVLVVDMSCFLDFLLLVLIGLVLMAILLLLVKLILLLLLRLRLVGWAIVVILMYKVFPLLCRLVRNIEAGVLLLLMWLLLLMMLLCWLHPSLPASSLFSLLSSAQSSFIAANSLTRAPIHLCHLCRRLRHTVPPSSLCGGTGNHSARLLSLLRRYCWWWMEDQVVQLDL